MSWAGVFAVAAGAVGGAAGSIASQGLGIAIGQQSSFNWGQVGLAAIGGAVNFGVGQIPGLSGGSGFAGAEQAFARNAIGGFITNDIGVVTGLESPSQFNWAGIAESSIAAGVSAGVAGSSFGRSLGPVGDSLASNLAGGFAGAATTSLLSHTDFGSNLLNALPNAIGQTIGNAVAQGISNDNGGGSNGQAQAAPQAGGSNGGGGGQSSPITLPNGQVVDWVDYTPTSWANTGAPSQLKVDYYVWDDTANNGQGGDVLYQSSNVSARDLLVNGQSTAMQDIAQATTSSNITADQQARLQRDYSFLSGGQVTVNFTSNLNDPGAAGNASIKNYHDTINIDVTQPGYFNPDGSPDYLAVASTLVHEGQHGLDAVFYHEPNGPSGSATSGGLANIVSLDRRTEINAYGTQAIFDQAMGYTQAYNLVNGQLGVVLTPATANQVAEGSVKIVQTQLHNSYPNLIGPYSVPAWMK